MDIQNGVAPETLGSIAGRCKFRDAEAASCPESLVRVAMTLEKNLEESNFRLFS